MKCPYCAVEIHDYFEDNARQIWEYPTDLDSESTSGGWWVSVMDCPACKKHLIQLWHMEEKAQDALVTTEKFIAYPRFAARPLPKEVQDPFRNDFFEACAVLTASPKASAALSRRCLQALLKDQGYTEKDLAAQIDSLLKASILPSHLRNVIDAVRNIGNFAAHPSKNRASGEIVEVDPVEAEWLLDVLEALFDFFIVQPAHSSAKTAALNTKLAAIGKPPIK
jgi:hypothetical protein